MALTSSAIVPSNSLEEFRLEFNKLRVDVTALDTADTYVSNIVFEGSTTDDYQTTLAVTDPTADRTWTLPNVTDTVVGLATTDTLTNKTLITPIIAEIDSGSSITLDATTSISLDANTTVTLNAAAGDVNLTPAANYDVNIPSNIGLTFGDDGEKIEGNGTDLTVSSGGTINLTATSDVVIPANVGVTFGTGEKIEGNNTDLTVTSGADINLTATGDVNIPSGVGVTFGNDGEKIEGDGTNLTVASSAALTLTSTSHTVDSSGDIVLDADSGDIFFKDGGTIFGSATNTSGDLIVKSGTTTALTFNGANVTAAGTIASGAITSTGIVTGTGFTAGNAIITEAELEMLDGITAGTAAANKVVVLDSSKNIATIGTIASAAITSTGVVTATGFTIGSAVIAEAELEMLDGITAGTAAASKALVLDSDKDIGTIRNLTIDGVFTDGNYTFDTSGNVSGLGTVASGAITSTGIITGTGFTIGSAVISEVDLEKLDDISNGTAAANKAVVLNASKNITGIGTIGSGAITSSGVVTATGFTIGSAVINEAELEMLDGITVGTAAGSKAVVLDSNKDIGTIRNLTIDGTFSDGNYTFDTSGNVSGLGTISSGAITSSGTITASGFTIGSAIITEAELEMLDGITAGTAAASKAVVLDSSTNITGIGTIGSGAITSSGVVTATGFTIGSAVIAESELEMLDGITAGTAAASKAVVLNASKDIGTIRNLTIDGVFTDGNYTFDTSGNVSGLGTVASGAITSSGVVTATGFTIGSAVIAEAELEMLDGITAGTAAGSKAVVLSANKDIGTLRNLTIDGTFSDGNYTFDTSGNVSGLGTIASGAITSTGVVTGTGFTIGSAVINEAELEQIDGITAGTAAASKALVVDSSTNITGIGTIGSGAITSSGVVTATGFTIGSAVINEAELETLDGVTAGTAAASKAVILDANKDITGMRNVTIAGDLTVNGTTTTVNSNTINVQHSMVFEGATADAYETTLTVTDPTADRTITLPNLTGTVSLLDATETLTNKTLTTPVIAEIDSGSTIILDATTDIVLDADGGDIFFKDGGTTFGSATNTSGNLIVKSGTTTALTFSGADVTVAGDLTVSGDDLFMATNTSGAALIADGTNFNPVVISGDITIGTNGVAALGTGVIVNADVNASAAIADSKLGTISTVDKVSGAAIQVDGATSGTGITLAATDKFLVDDSGTTKYINASQINTFVATAEGLASVDDVTALAIALG